MVQLSNQSFDYEPIHVSGTPEERGLISRHQNKTEDTTTEADNYHFRDNPVDVYDVPCCTVCVRHCDALSCLPFMPDVKTKAKHSKHYSKAQTCETKMEEKVNQV